MKNLVIVILVLVAAGLVGWAATSVRNDQQAEPARAAVPAAPVESARSESVVFEPTGESSTEPSTTTTMQPSNSQDATTRPGEEPLAENAMSALHHAANAKKHLYVFVQGKEQDEPTREARKTFDAALAKLGDKVQSLVVDRDDAAERQFVEKYALQSAPLPVVLVLAPNGAVTGGFLGTQLSEQRLAEAIAGPVKQQCLKALQDRKLVLLCAQNGNTTSNDTAMKGVNEFKSDSRFAEFTEIVMLDPASDAESSFLVQLQIAPKMSEATTILLAPPGTLVAKFTGATQKDALVTALMKASSGCGPRGCGPRGCGPKK